MRDRDKITRLLQTTHRGKWVSRVDYQKIVTEIIIYLILVTYYKNYIACGSIQ